MNEPTFINPAATKAILIGVSEYKDKRFLDAPPIKNNVDKLAQLLKDRDILGLPEERILVFNNKEGNLDILSRIREFIGYDSPDHGDTVLFYFSGHGYKAADDKLYLVTHNTNEDDIELSAIPWVKIKEVIEKGPGIQQRLYILDACHAGLAFLGENKTEVQLASGSALIAAAQANQKATFNSTDTYTHFTEALIGILERGVEKFDVPLISYDLLYQGLKEALRDRSFSICPKLTNEIGSVAFFKNKRYDTQAVKRNPILNLETQGDEAMKRHDLEQAKKDYLEAQHRARRCGFDDDFKRLDEKIEEIERIKEYQPFFERQIAGRIQHYEKQLADSAEKWQSAKADADRSQEQLHDIESKLAESQQNVQTNTELINQLTTQKEKLQKQLDAQTKKLKEQTEQISDLQQQIKSLQKELETKTALIETLKDDKEKLKKIISDLTKVSEKQVVKQPETGKNFTQTIGNFSFDMVFIPGGTFRIGSDDGHDDEKVRKEIMLSDFYLAKFEVSIGEYLAFCSATNSNWPEWLEKGSEYHIETGTNDLYKKVGMSKANTDYPVTGVSWDNAKAYCAWLSKETGKNYGLPSEAQWEYAAGGGTADGHSRLQKWAGTDSEAELKDYAWYNPNSGGRVHSNTDKKNPNRLGLYNMSGNVWEWCEDDWHSTYEGIPADGKPWVDSNRGSSRVNRGGSWNCGADNCRVAIRNHWYPNYRDYGLGFRLGLFP